MPCSSCKREIKVVARGLCNACYQRWRKTGTTEYQRLGKTHPCQIKDCKNLAKAKGLCQMHYVRLLRHGHTEQTRPDSWGEKTSHPLYNVWAHLRRFKGIEEVCQEWLDDFLQFVADVGDRPSQKHKFFRADDSRPFGPDNFVWKRSFIEHVKGENAETFARRRAKAFRAVNPEAFRGYDLKRMYGLSASEYESLHKKQGGVCAICGDGEKNKIRGKSLHLSVDHCHATGAIRGLLCTACNTGLGCFKDDVRALRRAAAYLLAHRD